MKEGQASYVASIDKASIVVTLLLSFLILKEPITAKVLIGAGVNNGFNNLLACLASYSFVDEKLSLKL